jgi:hypothetical protein
MLFIPPLTAMCVTAYGQCGHPYLPIGCCSSMRQGRRVRTEFVRSKCGKLNIVLLNLFLPFVGVIR